MKKVLVVGGNGFIGAHLVDALVGSNREVTVVDQIDRKFSPLPSQVRFIKADFDHSITRIEKILDEVAPDVVFHLAWKTLPETSMTDPTRDIGINLIPTLNLIRVCTRSTIKLLFTSSGGAVYGAVDQPFISEKHSTAPISPYGIEKLMAEKYLFMYRHLFGLDYMILRPSTPFGPWQDYMGKQGAVAIFMYRVAKGLPVTLWGDGSIIRDYFYISDLVNAMVLCAEHDGREGRRIFNVGGGKGVSLIKLIGQIETIVGRKAVIVQGLSRKFDPHTVVLDTRLIQEQLGWAPKVSLQEGFIKTWEWMSKII